MLQCPLWWQEKRESSKLRGDFVYMDPPFSITAHRMFNEYNATLFGHERLKQLRQEMEKLADHKIKFLVSYARSDEAELLGRGFHSCRVPVRRNIAGFSANRRTADEMLIYN